LDNPLDNQVDSLPPLKGTRPMLGKVIRWAIVLFIVFYVATQPAGAAGLAHHLYNGLHDAATSAARFVNSL
jgi:hypothetical protein